MSFVHSSSHSFSRFSRGIHQVGDDYPCTVSQWQDGIGCNTFATSKASDFDAVKDAPLTIIHAPLDGSDPEHIAGFKAITERYRIPGPFVDESGRHVINSFGHLEESKVSTYTWLRFLLKEVEQEEVPIHHVDYDHRHPGPDLGRILTFFLDKTPQKQESTGGVSGPRIPLQMGAGDESLPHAQNWTRCAFFLRADKAKAVSVSVDADLAPSISRSWQESEQDGGQEEGGTGDKQTTATGTSPTIVSGQDVCSESKVTLICFNTPFEIKTELEALSSTLKIADILEHPYILWELITFHLSTFLDEEVYKLTECFTTEQLSLGYFTGKPSKPLSDIDFSSLHLLADHIILVLEGAKGLSATMHGLINHHKAVYKKTPSTLAHRTQRALEYRQRFVHSTMERGFTFEKRVNNMLSLFFHHISLQDSAYMMRDSSSLRSIAFLTLVFLPITTIATICGSEFFYTVEHNDGRPASIRVSDSSWVMFLTSALVTLCLVMAWKWNSARFERQFSRGMTHRSRSKNIPLVV